MAVISVKANGEVVKPKGSTTKADNSTTEKKD